MKLILTAEEIEDTNGKKCIKVKSAIVSSTYNPSRNRKFVRKVSRLNKLSQHLRSHIKGSRELKKYCKKSISKEICVL